MIAGHTDDTDTTRQYRKKSKVNIPLSDIGNLLTVARFRSGHPETRRIQPVAYKCLGDLLHVADNAANQPDTGSFEHSVEPFAYTAADDGIGVEFLYHLEPFG